MKDDFDVAVGRENVEDIKADIHAAKMESKAADLEDTIKVSLLPDSPPPVPRSPSLKDEEQDDIDMIERDQKRSGSSRLESPDEIRSSSRRRKGAVRLSPVGPTQTIEHLPIAKNEALSTFEEMKDNWYQNHKVGRSRGYEKEAMVCECHYRHGVDDPMMACGEDAGCINRLTQVECRASDCNCGDYCQNRRFQNHEYVDVEIVQTEKKGFGLRASKAVPTDRLIYEYIGEVVEQSEFMRRMQQYKDEGIRHYYFMMLQREEFLDATKKGGIARFINHSCNPNCYVSKWHVGKHMRMGIFSKRDIIPGEELTFNYNVDRYGNEAQACYCGEPNCVGAIGGKTQTDIGGMDELFIDALGITEEVNRLEARGTRKKKSRHLDEDFNPTLRPMEEDEVAKMITAIRQAASNRTILQKLITRIHMTSDTDVQRNLVQLHGFVLMAGILDEWKDDKEIVLLVMGSLARWPLIARNKVVDSGVDKLVKEFSEVEDTELSSLAKDLLNAWDALEMSYRIARKENDKSSERHTLSFAQRKADDLDDVAPRVTLAEARAPNTISRRLENVAPKPLIHPGAEEESRHSGYRDNRRGNDNWQRDRRNRFDSRPRHQTSSYERYVDESFNGGTPARVKFYDNSQRQSPAVTPVGTSKVQPPSIEEIIRKAYESEAAQRKKAEEAAAAASAEAAMRRTESSEKRPSLAGMKRRSTTKLSSDKRRRTNEPFSNQEGEKESALDVAEKRMKKLLGEIVVRCMSLYKDDLDRDAFKKHAKDLTNVLCEKEKRNPKKGKIKSFANDYIRKLIAHKARKQSTTNAGPSDTPASTSHSIETPQENVGRAEVGVKFGKRTTDFEEDEVDFGDSPNSSMLNIHDSPASGSRTGTEMLSVNGVHGLDSAASTTTNTSTDQAAPNTPLDINLTTSFVPK
ncbi:hypothetical protein L7F22_052781 [Adiantum nelumboides]|nr:hypothetical protein [Adiantum nelumboides]